MDYQTRLLKLLDMLDAQGRIRVLARERMEFAPTLGASLMIFFCGQDGREASGATYYAKSVNQMG